MNRRLIGPILMISLGVNLLFGYQNCGQVDPAFVFNEDNKSEKTTDVADATVVPMPQKKVKPYVYVSKVKVTKSELTRFQRSVKYDFNLEFRLKYTTQYIGVEPVLVKPLQILDSKNNTLAKLALDDVEFLEKECIESIDKNQQTYFDCHYLMKVSKGLDVAATSAIKQKYKIENSKKGIEFELVNRGKTIASKQFKTSINYIDKYVAQVKYTAKKAKARLPKVAVKVKSKSKGKSVALDTKPAKKLSLKKKMIEPEVKLVEGVYCHIKVLNPPHLEILSDVKKVGTYYEDAETCREVAIKLSKTYCSHSLMGEIDINWSLKDKRQEGEKVLDKNIESIECAGLN